MSRTFFFASTVMVGQCIGAISPNVHAADATCAAMIKQTLPRPDLPYLAEQELLVDDKSVKNQAVYIEGSMHVKAENGKWIRTQKPVDPKAVESLALETTRDCKLTGSEIVGTWIGAPDGRAYRQSSDGLEQRIYYDNVIKPEVEEGRRRTRVGAG